MLFAQLLDQCADLNDLLRVQTDSGLVQNQDRRVADQCLCQTDTLAVALGQVLDDTTGNVADAAQVAHVFQM